jgi:2-phospho-L-lactate/phosphoenolpyruvate guanylyltransferase
VLAIVPVKGLENAKTRLAPVLSARERALLVREMLECVLEACGEAAAVTDILVVTPDPSLAREIDVLVDEGAGHARAIAKALADPRARNGALIVMADCPLALPEPLDRLAESARSVALAPAEDGGLNALALTDPRSFKPVFGVPDSARVTLERARTAGLSPTVLDEPLLAFDVDRPADLQRLRALVTA